MSRLGREDRFSAPGSATEAHGALGLLIGTAVVAGSVIGLLAYDARHPFGYGTAPAPALVIPVEPLSPDER